ncbi:hypothetical protein Acr_08g0006610 [Actinidia rufa]|uniref:Uncharacterized protein n=1 Tax=Actinidia rufa TaxID=165716 RepID=A0A7J0F0P5_9ERIC|nr:hypothetical protein Acr_08g0006610 [Actinidia rufa]
MNQNSSKQKHNRVVDFITRFNGFPKLRIRLPHVVDALHCVIHAFCPVPIKCLEAYNLIEAALLPKPAKNSSNMLFICICEELLLEFLAGLGRRAASMRLYDICEELLHKR